MRVLPLLFCLLIATAFAVEEEVDVDVEAEEENTAFAGAGVALTREQAIYAYAPLIYTHTGDELKPSSTDFVLSTAQIRFSNGTLINWSDAARQGRAYIASLTDTQLTNGWSNTNAYKGQPVFNNEISAKVYVHTVTRSTGDQDIKYFTFYPRNGCQRMRFQWKEPCGFFDMCSKSDVFKWCDLARHEGDWEYVMVRTSNDYSTIKVIHMSAHGAGTVVYPGQFSLSGTHPIAYSAAGSHALYPSVGFFAQDSYTVSGVGLKIGDQTQQGYAWKTWNYIEDIDTTQPDWLEYPGGWGYIKNELDTFPTGAPLAIQLIAPAAWLVLKEVMDNNDKTEKKFKIGIVNGPRGPKAANGGLDKDPLA